MSEERTMNVPIVTAEVEGYLDSILPARDPVLQAMEERAREHGFPIIGPQVGRMLHTLARATGAKRVLELGSGFGYSAIWIARAFGPEGSITCTEGSEENVAYLEEAFAKAGLSDRLTVHCGNACDLLESTIPGEFDMILCDIDKWEYPRAFDVAIPRVRIGGLMICDNLLWDGKVLGGDPDRDTAGVLEYTRKAMSDPRVSTTVVPMRDGVGVSCRIA